MQLLTQYHWFNLQEGMQLSNQYHMFPLQERRRCKQKNLSLSKTPAETDHLNKFKEDLLLWKGFRAYSSLHFNSPSPIISTILWRLASTCSKQNRNMNRWCLSLCSIKWLRFLSVLQSVNMHNRGASIAANKLYISTESVHWCPTKPLKSSVAWKQRRLCRKQQTHPYFQDSCIFGNWNHMY